MVEKWRRVADWQFKYCPVIPSSRMWPLPHICEAQNHRPIQWPIQLLFHECKHLLANAILKLSKPSRTRLYLREREAQSSSDPNCPNTLRERRTWLAFMMHTMPYPSQTREQRCECEGKFLCNTELKKICNFQNKNLVRLTTRNSLRPSAPQPNMPTYPITSFRLVPTLGILKTTSKYKFYIRFKPKNSKNS